MHGVVVTEARDVSAKPLFNMVAPLSMALPSETWPIFWCCKVSEVLEVLITPFFNKIASLTRASDLRG
jgi:hypothetical protein